METKSKGESVVETTPIEIKNLLKEINFPAKKNDIIEQASKSSAIKDTLLQQLGMLQDKEYSSADEVFEELERR